MSPRAKAGDRMTLPSTAFVLTAFQSVCGGLRRAGAEGGFRNRQDARSKEKRWWHSV